MSRPSNFLSSRPASRLLFHVISIVSFTVLVTTFGLAQSGLDSSSQDSRIGSLIALLGKTRTPAQSVISPDGSEVAWSVRTKEGEQIRLTPVGAAGKDRLVETGSKVNGCGSSDPAWSPDGDWLAFTSDCVAGTEKPDQRQVFVWSRKTGAAKQLTHVTGEVDSLAWSPDGKTVGFLFVENATRSAGALAAMKPWAGVIGEDGVEIQRVGMVDVASGSFAQVTPEKLHVYEFSWSPDSKQVTYVAANPPGENNWWVAQLYVQTVLRPGMRTLQAVAPGTYEPKSILNTQMIGGALHGLQIALPRFSDDGKRIAFIGGLMSDQGSTGGDIWVVPAEGGEAKDLTAGRPTSVAYFGWVDDTHLGIAEHLGGDSRVTVLDLTTGKDSATQTLVLPESIGSGQSVMSVSVASNGDVAFVRSSFEQAPEVWAGPLTKMRQITHLNDGLKPAWGKTENIEWSNEGFKVQGWLLYPAGWSPQDGGPGKKYPLIVSVHGGPSSAVTPRWPGVGYGGVPFSALGYFVFMPNPRGSYGQGERFTQANIKDFGYGDLRDILTGMDVLEKRFPIDTHREGLTGWSYGGFMTMFGVTQTTRFRAAVAGAGISDWQSYYGENSIDQWMTPFFGATVYDDPAVYAKSSAIDYIKKVKTPTLVVVGDRDGECPAPQSFEFWHALRAEGVKTELVVYPNEGHGFRDPVHRRDVLERALRWFETEMPAGQ